MSESDDMEKEAMRLEPAGKNKYGAEDERDVESDDYDPHIHRTVPNPTTNAETLIHILKGSLGTGILAMPKAFKDSGMVNGIIFTILIGFLCTYCLHMLVQAQYVLCKRLKVPILTYPESMKIALNSGPIWLRKFANMSPLIVDIFLIIYQFGICCVYVLFVGVNLKDFVDIYLENPWDIKIYMLIILLPFILMISIRNLKLLAPFSTLANILTFVSFGIVLSYIFQNLPSVTDRPAFGSLYTFPLYFGTTLFALEAVGVVIAVENNMKTPKDFGGYWGVLNKAMVVITILYVGMGFLGYWRYGDDSADSITLNFPPTDKSAKVVKILYSIAIYISYGLQGFVPIDILWNTYIVKNLEGSKYLLQWEYVLRISSVILTFILAATIPLLGLFISFFGAFCLSALGLAFPAIMEICIRWPDNFGPCRFVLLKDVIIIVIGVIGLLAGSYSSLSEIILELSKK